MVSHELVQDYVRKGKTEAEGCTDIQFENLQTNMNRELQKLMTVAEATDAKVAWAGVGPGNEVSSC